MAPPDLNHRRNGRFRARNKAASKGGLTHKYTLRCTEGQSVDWEEARAIAGYKRVPDWARTELADAARRIRRRAYINPDPPPPPG